MRYLVTWTIDIDEEHIATPQDAAREALRIQRKPDSIATVFDVREDGADDAVRVDLDELGE